MSRHDTFYRSLFDEPLVMHTGDAPWSAATDIQTLQADTPPWLQRYNPGQAFLLIEQKQLLLKLLLTSPKA